MNMIVLSPDRAFDVDRERVEEAARTRFGPDIKVIQETDDSAPMDVTIRVNRPGEPMFQIFHSRRGTAIHTDGTPEQAVEVALWVRSLLPDNPGGRIWMVDEAFNGHVELVPGMTSHMVRDGWIDHSAHPELAE